MIQLTDINGRTHAIHPDAIARLVEPGSSGKWHGVNCYVRTFDGDTIEVRENVFEVMGLIKSGQGGQAMKTFCLGYEHQKCRTCQHEKNWATLNQMPDALPLMRDGSKLYTLPGAQLAPNAVAYLDLGAGGYRDIGTDLTDEELDALPKGRHMLGIVGTYGVEGYVPAQPAPSVPEVTDAMIEAVESRAEQSYRRHHSGIRGQQITPADALSWHIIHATRSVLVEAVESSRAP